VQMLMPKSKHAAISLAKPPSESMEEIDKAVNAVRGKREKNGTQFIEMQCDHGLSPMMLRGRLGEGTAIITDERGVHVYFAQPDDVEVTLKKEGPPKKRNRGTLRIRDEKLSCKISDVSYERLAACKASGGKAAVPPAPQGVPGAQ